jgi:hypothetical protein
MIPTGEKKQPPANAGIVMPTVVGMTLVYGPMNVSLWGSV